MGGGGAVSPRVWLVTMESIYTRKVGGLAEVPPRLASALIEKGVLAEVVTPGHGVDCPAGSVLFETVLFGEKYLVEKCVFEVPHLLIRGGVFDEETVYPRERLGEKALLFGAVVTRFFRELVKRGEHPRVVHGNDWHSAPLLLGVNVASTEAGLDTRLIYHIHLLTSTSIKLEEYERYLGVSRNTPLRGVLGLKKLEEYYRETGGYVDKLASYISTKTVTVSKQFTKNVKRALGESSLVEVDYIFNATTWGTREVYAAVAKLTGLDPSRVETKREARRQLLTKTFSNLSFNPGSKDVALIVEHLALKYGVKYNEPFPSDGVFVFLSGRITRQKGFDLLAKAMDRLVANEPSLRVVVAGIPLSGTERELEMLVETQALYREHFRVIPGYVEPDVYKLFYYSSDVYLAPSRYEPFGLVALEALSAGTPVVASNTGGLADIVVDLRRDPDKGVGALFEPGDMAGLVDALSYLLEFIESSDRRELLRLRDNCLQRASQFTWEKSAEKALVVYGLR